MWYSFEPSSNHKTTFTMETRLERLRDEAILGGVAAGIARYFNIDRTLVRVLFIVSLFIVHFPAVLIYVILWVALPERRFGTLNEPLLYSNPTFSTMNPYNPSNPDRSQNTQNDEHNTANEVAL